MSTASQSQPNIAKLDHELNQAILSGDILNAFEKYYANDVAMQENDSEPFKGKEVNRKREQEFVNSVEQFHGAKLLAEAVNGDASFSEWEYDVTFKGGGGRAILLQGQPLVGCSWGRSTTCRFDVKLIASVARRGNMAFRSTKQSPEPMQSAASTIPG
jgi:ketosteroid isomerase-like protein